MVWGEIKGALAEVLSSRPLWIEVGSFCQELGWERNGGGHWDLKPERDDGVTMGGPMWQQAKRQGTDCVER